MADDRDSLVVVQRREIRAELSNIGGRPGGHDKHLERIAEAACMGVGLATMADHKLDRMAEWLIRWTGGNRRWKAKGRSKADQ